jgi:DnaK suppressor protein
MPRSVFAGDGDNALPARKKTTAKSAAKGGKKKTATRKVSGKKVPKKAAKKVRKKAAPAKKAAAKKTRAKKTLTKKASGKKAAPKKTAAKKKAVKKSPAKKKTRKKARASRNRLMTGPLHGFLPYKNKRGERYMNTSHLKHFKNILSAWRQALMEEVDRTVDHMKDEAANFPDPNDRATQESEFGLELRTRDRERKLIRKISQALTRIDDGTYGYCEETGDEIGLKRLEARPVATLCLDAQERREMAERQYRDRDDRYR